MAALQTARRAPNFCFLPKLRLAEGRLEKGEQKAQSGKHRAAQKSKPRTPSGNLGASKVPAKVPETSSTKGPVLGPKNGQLQSCSLLAVAQTATNRFNQSFTWAQSFDLHPIAAAEGILFSLSTICESKMQLFGPNFGPKTCSFGRKTCSFLLKGPKMGKKLQQNGHLEAEKKADSKGE